MAKVFGDLRPRATEGERKVLRLLQNLSDEYIVWPELPINSGYLIYPDFVVLHPRLGLTVLEVKDWVYIVEANPSTWKVQTRKGDVRSEKSPLVATHEKATKIVEKLQENPRLVHAEGPHRGKLILPWTYGVVFPNLTRLLSSELDPLIPECVIWQDDLETGQFEECLFRLPRPFEANLTPKQARHRAQRALFLI